MPKFTFKARDADNRIICGDLQAPTAALAELRLRKTYVKLLGLWDENNRPLIGRPAVLFVFVLAIGIAIAGWFWARL